MGAQAGGPRRLWCLGHKEKGKATATLWALHGWALPKRGALAAVCSPRSQPGAHPQLPPVLRCCMEALHHVFQHGSLHNMVPVGRPPLHKQGLFLLHGFPLPPPHPQAPPGEHQVLPLGDHEYGD